MPPPRGPCFAATMHPRLTILGLLLAPACGGGLSYRSFAEAKTEIAVDAAVRKVRIEVENGTVEIGPIDAASRGLAVACSGGVRRAADTPEALAAIEQVPIELTAVPTGDPALLCLRAPHLPPAVDGVLGFEARILLPADLPLELVAAHSCHVTVSDRAAATEVQTGRGDLRFERCVGGVKARTGRGMVIAFGHRGDLDIHTMVGDMQAFVVEPGRVLRLVTGQGTVQCQVPEKLDFAVDARAEIGRIGNGFGLPVERVGDYGAALVGRRGAGGTDIVLRTGSGHLSLTPRKFD